MQVSPLEPALSLSGTQYQQEDTTLISPERAGGCRPLASEADPIGSRFHQISHGHDGDGGKDVRCVGRGTGMLLASTRPCSAGDGRGAGRKHLVPLGVDETDGRRFKVDTARREGGKV